jgi:ATP-dependent Clp protease adaptor protein ClpS
MSEKTIFRHKTDQEIKLQKPSMFKIILHNDDYTTTDFVVEVLVNIFHKPLPEATKIMLDVHNKGKGVVGIYTYDIAVTKIAQVNQLAHKREFPLKVSLEEA